MAMATWRVVSRQLSLQRFARRPGQPSRSRRTKDFCEIDSTQAIFDLFWGPKARDSRIRLYSSYSLYISVLLQVLRGGLAEDVLGALRS